MTIRDKYFGWKDIFFSRFVHCCNEKSDQPQGSNIPLAKINFDNKTGYVEDGTINIAELAATEVDGVASMAGNITNELVSKLGMKNLSKGVKVEIVDSVVSVDLTLNIEYGMNILETSKKVQEKVKAAIENMTGLEVADVNIHIASVDMENEKSK